MNYEELIAEFTWRTRQNLEHIEEQEREGEPVFAVTQLWNSLLGLVVLLPERAGRGELDLVADLPLDELSALGWPRITSTRGEEPKGTRDLLRLLRNAVAHFNVEFNAPAPKEPITSVRIWNTPTRQPHKITWETTIDIDDLKALA